MIWSIYRSKVHKNKLISIEISWFDVYGGEENKTVLLVYRKQWLATAEEN